MKRKWKREGTKVFQAGTTQGEWVTKSGENVSMSAQRKKKM